MFRLADRLNAKLSSPHHPLVYNNHSMLRPGTYWHWSILFDITKPAYQGIGEFEYLLAELYPNRTVMICLHTFGAAEVFIAANHTDNVDGYKPLPGDAYVPWAGASGE
jgi:hypothetical protein